MSLSLLAGFSNTIEEKYTQFIEVVLNNYLNKELYDSITTQSTDERKVFYFEVSEDEVHMHLSKEDKGEDFEGFRIIAEGNNLIVKDCYHKYNVEYIIDLEKSSVLRRDNSEVIYSNKEVNSLESTFSFLVPMLVLADFIELFEDEIYIKRTLGG